MTTHTTMVTTTSRRINTMANEYRMIGIVFTLESNRSVLQAFIGELVCNGWEGPVPIATHHPDPDNVTERWKAWGGYLYPDMRLMVGSGKGVTRAFRTERVLLGEFAHEDCQEQCAAIIGAMQYPGFTPPQTTDAVAIIMTDCRFAPPFRWIKTVIDQYYDTGVRFFFKTFDLGDAAYGGANATAFYSADSDMPMDVQAYRLKSSEHCIAMDLSPILRQMVKTHFSLNGEWSHGVVT